LQSNCHRLPQSYIDEAEAKLQSEAEAYYDQNSQPRVQYELSIHDNFLKQFSEQITIANLFAVGDYISVQDSDVGVISAAELVGDESIEISIAGTFITFPVQQAKMLLARIQRYADKAYVNTERHKSAIEALETIEEVNDYDFTTGYPEKVTLSL
jgi:hypothetical protein